MYCEKLALIKECKLLKFELIREAMADLKYLIIKASGESMSPTIIDGENVIVDSVLSKNSLQIGDIILFYDFKYDLVLHRLISEGKNTFILQGDNVDTLDIIEFKNMLGKVNTNIKIEDLNLNEKKQYIRKVDDYSIVMNINSGELISFDIYPKEVK